MLFEGVLKKMRTELASEVQYYLEMKDDFVHVNQLLNKTISFKFKTYQCLNCGQDKRIFRQGFCYDCYFKSPKTGEWIMKPELSTAHLNQEDRDLEFEKQVQLQPHIVYLANSSDVKVGITRKTQVPTRWIDQGAHEAVPIFEVPNRYLSGVAEVALKAHVSDKTNWRNMLKNKIKNVDITKVRSQLEQYIPEEVKPYYLPDNEVVGIHFPVIEYPTKVKSLKFSKTLEYSGVLKGIKGQYFIFEDGVVINIRGNSGYVVEMGIKS